VDQGASDDERVFEYGTLFDLGDTVLGPVPRPERELLSLLGLMTRVGVRTARIGVEMARIGVEMARIGVEMARIGVEMARIGVEMARIGVEMARIGVKMP
jgi:hypothetical protein